jgi:hypothetical protein
MYGSMVFLGKIQQVREFFNGHAVLVVSKDNEADALC